MIPYGRQSIDQNDINEVIKVLNSNWLTQGPKVAEFEKAVAGYCGAKYAVACSNGTTALHLAYLAAGFKNGDEVITSPNTFVATTNMLLTLGVKPVFCDIRLDTYNIDENKIEKLITKRTKAIVPVHFAGQPCALDEIHRIAKKHKLLVIEDACHALGASFKNSKVGSCKFSDMTVFSFHPVKPITTGEGGLITTNNKKYFEKLVLLRNHGIFKDKKGKNVMVELGYNYRITDIQTVLGLSQLKKLNKFIKARRQVAEWYKEELGDFEDIILPTELPDNYSGWHIYIVRVKNRKNRDNLVAYLKENGVGVNFHYPAVYSHPFYRENGFKNIKLENEEEYQNSCLTLPCYVNLELAEVKFVCDKIKNFYGKKIVENFKKNSAIITGERIYLKIVRPENATVEYAGWLNDSEVNKYLETKSATVRGLKNYITEKLADDNCLFFGIFMKASNKHIGNLKLEPIDWQKKTAVFGILIGDKNYWGKGLATEASKLIIDLAFSKLNLTALELGVIADNAAALKVYEKIGFKVDEIKKGTINNSGQTLDQIIMSVKKYI